jgi:hypothetical protein
MTSTTTATLASVSTMFSDAPWLAPPHSTAVRQASSAGAMRLRVGQDIDEARG